MSGLQPGDVVPVGAFDHASASDMSRVAGIVRSVSDSSALPFAAAVVATGLMRTHWWLHLIVRLRCGRDTTRRMALWAKVLDRFPEVVETIILATARWAERGVDSSDATSAGGFNRSEVAALCILLDPARHSRERA